MPRPRRATRQTALAVLALLALGLVGCSAGGSNESGADGPAVVEGGDAGGGVSGAGAGDGGGEEAAEADRSVVIEGQMYIVVDDVGDATASTTRIVDAADGRIDGREEWRDEDAGGATASSTLVLRIPAEALDAAIDDLRALGTVESLNTSTVDVTADVQDIDAHIAALETTIARLTSFQAEASSVPDLLSIEREVSARQAELEGYLTRQAEIAERVSFSTLTLTLSSQAPPAEAPATFWAGLGVGWSSFTAFLGGLLVVLGVALPWLLGFGIVTVAIILFVRWIRRRRSPKPPVAPPPGQAMPAQPQQPPAPVGAMPPA
ncbi:hypothetical protein OB08_10460 [Microbacterium sp. HJ5]